jgi:hypothetical protein
MTPKEWEKREAEKLRQSIERQQEQPRPSGPVFEMVTWTVNGVRCPNGHPLELGGIVIRDTDERESFAPQCPACGSVAAVVQLPPGASAPARVRLDKTA